jgi:hypothetical protein
VITESASGSLVEPAVQSDCDCRMPAGTHNTLQVMVSGFTAMPYMVKSNYVISTK